MKKRYLFLFILFSIIAVWFYATSHIPALPPLKDGDLVFQTTVTPQSGAIIAATSSLYTHVGMITIENGRTLVIEAADVVGKRELNSWLDSGLLNRVAVYRDPELTQQQAQRVIAAAEKLLGRPYDIFFSFNNEEMYCSEVPYLAFQEAGVPLGQVQKLSELNVDNSQVKELIRQRWQMQPECKARQYDFDQCYQYIMGQELITPVVMSDDPKLQMIYSNYYF